MEPMSHDLFREGDRRAFTRYRVTMPLVVLLGDHRISAYTRDVSEHGVFFLVDSGDEGRIQNQIEFLIDFPPEVTLSAYCSVRCSGIVVRKERSLNLLTGMGARILQYSISV